MSTSRFAESPIEDRGTPESTWSSGTSPFAALDISSCRRLVVIAPHPDDEILGLGGLAASCAARGIDVSVVSVTDGGASHPGSQIHTRTALERLRRLESVSALRELGLAAPHRLGIPDGKVSAYEGDLERLIAGYLTDHAGECDAGTWCAATYCGDGHPDHEATGRSAHRAARKAGARFLEYPIWMWHWAVPGDAAVPWSRARSIALPTAVLDAKKRAVAHFHTQIRDLSPDPADRAVLPPWVLERLLRDHETVFV